jgi:tetratricopeptide (TPR) repeat protein
VPSERPTQSAQTTGDNSPATNIAVVLQTLERPWVIAAIIFLALTGGATLWSSYGGLREGRQHAENITGQLATQAAAQRHLERLVIDASAGGAPAVKAIADIRDIFRPAKPDIDDIPAEQLPGLVRRTLDELAKPTPSSPVDLPEAIRRAIAESQRLAGELRLADAAAGLDAKIAQRHAARQEEARADAALLGERGRIARLSLRYRDAAAFYSKAAALVGFDPAATLEYRWDSAGALYDLGSEFGDNEALRDAIAEYGQALALTPRERVPLGWATTQNNLGLALWTLGARESGTARLDEAVKAYRDALQERTRERLPLDWAGTQNNLGIALSTLGERESGTARLEEAVKAYRDALQELTRERLPLDWAGTQNNLGIALETLGARESGTARLEEAVKAYRDALQERTRARVPLDWAQTQNNLGNALSTLGARESGTARLDEAVKAYRDALQEWTRARVPLDWATTQNNLGVALSTLGGRESGTARLEEAVKAYRDALQETTRARVPLDWAQTQNNLGIALQRLGERESGTARLWTRR